MNSGFKNTLLDVHHYASAVFCDARDDLSASHHLSHAGSSMVVKMLKVELIHHH